jgi:hypothetical protein
MPMSRPAWSRFAACAGVQLAPIHVRLSGLRPLRRKFISLPGEPG